MDGGDVLAMSARVSTRPTRSPELGEAGDGPESRRRVGWPAGLIGALGLVLLLDPLIAGTPIGQHGASRLTASWEAAFRAAAEPEASAEILCFGDSLIKLGILPRVLEARLGRSAYNLAVLGGQSPTSHYLLRRVLDRGHSPRALIVNFSPLLLGMDPRVNLAWWAGLMNAQERLGLALQSRDPRLGLDLLLHGGIRTLSIRETSRAALGLGTLELRDREEGESGDELRTLLRNWSINRGAQVAPRPFVPIRGSLPQPYEGPGWKWRPNPVHASFVERFLALAEDRRIPVYWIIPPAEADWRARNEGVGTVDAYRAYVRRLVSRYSTLTVFDLQRANWGRAFFRDPIHLNRDGAVRLTLAVSGAIERARRGPDVDGRWIAMDGDARVPSRMSQELLEDLDQSRLAVGRVEGRSITMEGPRR